MKKRFNKIYLEISNLCNMRCAFCPGTNRVKKAMSEAEFSHLMPKLRPYSDFIYFHLMGEPLFHPGLESFLKIAGEHDFKVIITTNGTLLSEKQTVLLSSPALHKVNISLHAFEANDIPMPFEEYLKSCFSFGKAAEGSKLVVYRLWNQGGADSRNDAILSAMECFFAKPWNDERRGTRIGERIYLEYGDKFEWPDLSASDMGERTFCYGLRDQIGVLCDGTVVPCCLDHEGDINLGNLFDEDMDDILAKPRAKAIYEGFSGGKASEELCRKCGYAHMKFGL